jgi:Flp pilus assembly pilin Flp
MATLAASRNRGATLVETALLLVAVTVMTAAGVRAVAHSVRSNALASADELGGVSTIVVTKKARLEQVGPTASRTR